MAKRASATKTEDENWVRPAHSGFEGPAIGEVVPIGSVRQYRDGSTYVITENGPKRIK